ncbi:MAG: hypothetical protein JSU06_16405 [Actinobacteria bacterium]|nr:hypothetical protein [Actinomycetota bacterium]
MSDVLRLENYAEDADRAGDPDLVRLFRRAQETSRKGAERGRWSSATSSRSGC